MKKIFTFHFSLLLIFGCSVAFSRTPKQPPRQMTIGMLQIFCKNVGKGEDRSQTFANGYCEGYLKGLIDSYFEQISVKRTKIGRNACLLFDTNDWLRDEIRNEILAISDQRVLNLEYGPNAEPWVKSRLVAKCEPKR